MRDCGFRIYNSVYIECVIRQWRREYMCVVFFFGFMRFLFCIYNNLLYFCGVLIYDNAKTRIVIFMFWQREQWK